jgi:hypothetical protein
VTPVENAIEKMPTFHELLQALAIRTVPSASRQRDGVSVRGRLSPSRREYQRETTVPMVNSQLVQDCHSTNDYGVATFPVRS